jgi:hypothetical protein
VSRPWTVSAARRERALNNGDGCEQPNDLIDRPAQPRSSTGGDWRREAGLRCVHLTRIDYCRLLEQAIITMCQICTISNV